MPIRSVQLLLCCLLSIGCAAASAPQPQSSGTPQSPQIPQSPQVPPAENGPIGHRVLFIGNSLTSANDLPATLAAVAADGGDTIQTFAITAPNFALIDHLTGGSDAVGTIASRRWEYVVLQQGSSSLQISRDSLIIWTRMFDPFIRAAGARPALYMVWPTSDRIFAFDAVRVSYQEAAKAVGGLFLPAGAAWTIAWESDPNIQLYADGLHPTPLGTYLVALVMYERITGHDARDLPAVARAENTTLSTEPRIVRILQAAAHAANLKYPPG